VSDTGAVRSLARFREGQKAVRVLQVQRILAENTQNAKCYGTGRYRHKDHCDEPSEYIISTIGSKVGNFVCADCLEPMLRRLLIAPPEEIAKREQETIAEHLRVLARRERHRRRAEHVGCAGWVPADPDNLCHRPPVARCGRCHAKGPEAFCARHLVRHKKHGAGAIILPLEIAPAGEDAIRT